MNVFISGINSRGTGLLRAAGVLGSTNQTYRIEIDGDEPRESKLRREWRGVTQYFIDAGDDPPGTKVFRVKGPDDPALQGALQEIARTPHASVIVDMDLVMLGESKWLDQTERASRIATMLAQRRAADMPGSVNSIVAHSAGTVALAKSLKESGDLYANKAALSSMTWDLSPDVVIVQAAGDLPSTPTGGIADISLAGAAALDRDRWLSNGNTVVRVSGRGFDVQPSSVYLAEAAAMAAGPAANAVIDWVSRLKAHAWASDIGVRDGRVQVTVPIQLKGKAGEPPPPYRVASFELKNVSSGQVLKVLSGLGGPSVEPGDPRHTQWDLLKEEIKRLEPPNGGGIALRAAAKLPMAPADIQSAAWDRAESRILLRGWDRTWTLPPMDPKIVRSAFFCIFGQTSIDPEFSIGASLRGAEDATAPGMRQTQFLPESILRSTKLGYVMYRADFALSDIAYGGTPALAARDLTAIPGYHSLPEMYPAKYTENPDALVGVDERIVIESLPSVLAPTAAGALAFEVRQELAVRFGRTTPVERAYADLFTANYAQILERVPELRALVEASRIVGVLKWLREHNVPFDATPLEDIPDLHYETPAQTPFTPPPARAEITRRLPLVLYGEEGPVIVQSEEGATTSISYARGLVSRIERSDGKTFEVFTDDRGEPLALSIDGVGASAFAPNTEGYVTVHDDVVLHGGRDRPLAIERRATTRSAPETDPRALVNAVAAAFLERRDLRPTVGEVPAVTPRTAFGLMAALVVVLVIAAGAKRGSAK